MIERLNFESVLKEPLFSREFHTLPDFFSKQAVREAATICPRPLQVDLWPFDLESGVRVTYDVGYLCGSFSLPRPLCSRLRPDVRDRQTSDVRQTSDAHHRLMPLILGAGHNKSLHTAYLPGQRYIVASISPPPHIFLRILRRFYALLLLLLTDTIEIARKTE